MCVRKGENVCVKCSVCKSERMSVRLNCAIKKWEKSPSLWPALHFPHVLTHTPSISFSFTHPHILQHTRHTNENNVENTACPLLSSFTPASKGCVRVKGRGGTPQKERPRERVSHAWPGVRRGWGWYNGRRCCASRPGPGRDAKVGAGVFTCSSQPCFTSGE